MTKEKYGLGVVCSWTEVGVFLHWQRGRHMDCYMRYSSLLVIAQLFTYIFSVLYLSLTLLTDPMQLDMEGLQKIESAVAGLEVEGLYGLLRGAISYSLVSSIPPQLKNATTPHVPPSPSHPLKSLKKLHLKLLLLQLEKMNWHWKFPLQLYHKLWRWLSLPTWHPFACSWGASRGSINAKWRVAVRGHQPHMPLSVCMGTGII